tara:strand:+ start:369 stop:695 length:327 start_codon:yes stop_codon:yes gene_type:complete
MKIISGYKEEWFGILPQLFMNILELMKVEGDFLEIEGYPGGGLDLIDYNLDDSITTDGWLVEFEKWIDSHYNLDSLSFGDDDGEGLQTWMFKFEVINGNIVFHDEVVG